MHTYAQLHHYNPYICITNSSCYQAVG